MVQRGQARQFVKVACTLATFIIGGNAVGPSLRAESRAAGRMLQAVVSRSLGCFMDSREERVLEPTSMSSSIMTPDGCGDTCKGLNYKYYAVQHGRECWCGQEGVNYSKLGKLDSSACTTKCQGDKTIYCGGSNAFEIFEYITVEEPLKEAEPLGCWTDVKRDRVFDNLQTGASTVNTPAQCATSCGSDFAYFGVQNGDECFCGLATEDYTKHGESTLCTTPCAGDRSVDCGGHLAIEVFRIGDMPMPSPTPGGLPGPLGCWADVKKDRVFDNLPTRSSTANTVANCATSCGSDFAYFGVQNGDECFCGLATEDYTRHGKSTLCTTPCTGDRSVDCGGHLAIEVFRIGEEVPMAPPAEVPTPSPPTTQAPVTRTPGGFPGYLGCWTDSKKSRVFTSAFTETRDNTPETCQTTCSDYAFFGLQNGDECFCGTKGDDYERHGESDECTVDCSGDYAESKCGGPWAMDVYSTGDYTPPTPAPATTFGGVDGCKVVLIEAEDLDLVGDWNIKSDPVASGGEYIVWEGLGNNESNNRKAADIIAAVVKITVPGTYRFKWKMRQPDGVESDKANDTWLYFPNAARFGPLNSDASYGEFVKVYGRALNGVFEYSGTAEDGNTHEHSQIAVDFKEAGEYTMEIAGRSHGHEIDQIVLYDDSLNVNTAARGCQE